MNRDAITEDRVADLRARWTPEATRAAVAFLESRPVNYDLPTIERDLAPHAPLARLLSVVCAAAGIGTFGLLIASVTKKIMYR